MFSALTSAFFSMSLTISSRAGSQIDRHRFLVRIEVIGIVIGLAGPQPPAGLAGLGVLHLDHLGAQPRERRGAGCSGLELGEIDDPNALEKIHIHDVDRLALAALPAVVVPRERSDPLRQSAPALILSLRKRRPRPVGWGLHFEACVR